MRIVVTGLGVVSPLGVGLRLTAEGILAGRTGISPLTLFHLPGARVATAGQVSALPEGPGSRADRMAVTAAREALGDLPAEARRAMPLFVGGTMGGMAEAEAALAALTADPTRDDYDHGSIPGHVLTAPADRVHATLGPFADVRTVCSACSGGALAIALAAASLRMGSCERVLAGGVDALSRMSLAGFASLSALDPAPCRPFDASRVGLSVGEGAGFMLLETEAAARARGATILAELAGWAVASEAHHVTQPAPDGAIVRHTMTRAVERAGLRAGDVGYVNAHGTGTPFNDPMEARAIASAFGPVAVSSLKGSIGHALAAAGAIEAAMTVHALRHGVLPPTVGLRDVDPACEGIDHVREARPARVAAALSSSFGFGGTDVVLAFRPVDAAPQGHGGEAQAPVVLPPVITASCAFGPLGWGVDPRHYLDPEGEGPEPARPADAPLALPEGALDAMRSRRFDRASRLATLVAEEVLAARADRETTGIVVGSAFGSVEATGALLRQIEEKGVRFASPAAFPSVLPSALASNPSIYLGLRGPALACSDLGVSGEAALVLGALLLADRQADAVVVCAVEEHSAVASAVSSPRVSGLRGPGRAEGAAALLLERADAATSRGARVLATVAGTWSYRGARPDLPRPSTGRAMTLVGRPDLQAPPGWPRARALRAAGHHECVGGLALAAAVALLAEGDADEVLVRGEAPDRGHAVWLRAAGPR